MSYIPDNSKVKELARPNALTVIKHTQSTSQIATVNNKVSLDTVNNWFGSFTPTISNDIITLPAGYFYYIESSSQAYIIDSASYNFNHVTSFQHYNETSSSLTGTIGTVASSYSEDLQTFSRDSTARLLLDCSSASADVSFRIHSNSGHTHINYNSSQYDYAALGRTVIWQLNT